MPDVPTAAEKPSQARPTPLPLRNDTMLGVCAALGEEFGFNPNYLRVAISSLVIFNIMLAIGVYLALGVAVALGRLLLPPHRDSGGDIGATQPVVEANDAAAAPDSLAA